MLNPADNYFSTLHEPVKSCLLFLREHILAFDDHIIEAWKYGMPFYCYQRKMFCYLWTHKKYKLPYLGIVDGKRVDHPDLLKENRAQMKILLVYPERDIPLQEINAILRQAMCDEG